MQRALSIPLNGKICVMNSVQSTAQEKSVLRWGGLAGIVGGIVFMIVFVIVGVFVGMEFVEVARFPDVRTARIVENSLYLAVLILWVPHFLALYRALRATSLAPALFGSVLGILGLVVLAADALHHIWQTPISDLYHAPGATREAQAARTDAFLRHRRAHRLGDRAGGCRDRGEDEYGHRGGGEPGKRDEQGADLHLRSPRTNQPTA